MSHQTEKRAGSERRQASRPTMLVYGERRADERRQTSVQDISFSEWVRQLTLFRQRRHAVQNPAMQEAVLASSTTDQNRQE